MPRPTGPSDTTRAARRAQLLFERHCAAVRRQSLRVTVRRPASLPLPQHVGSREAGTRAA